MTLFLSPFPRRLKDLSDPIVRKAIERFIVDPNAPPEPLVTPASVIATMGSCFSGEIAKALTARGFSARQNFLQESWNSAFAVEHFLRFILDGAPLPDTFKTVQFTEDERARNNKGLSNCDLFILTLGLSLCWFTTSGHLVLHPKDVEDGYSPENVRRFQDYSSQLVMRQTSVDENAAAIKRCVDIIARHNPNAHIVLTLSPIPLNGAVCENGSVAANTVSKATLRAAIDQVMREKRPGLLYWPSYEIVTWYGAHVERAFGDDDRDSRHLRQKVIDIIADCFMARYVKPALQSQGAHHA